MIFMCTDLTFVTADETTDEYSRNETSRLTMSMSDNRDKNFVRILLYESRRSRESEAYGCEWFLT